MQRSLFLSVVLLAMSFFSFSQKEKNKEFSKANFPNDAKGLKDAEKAIGKGDDLYNKGHLFYSQALEFYLQAQDFNPDNAELNFKIGTCCLWSTSKLKAIPYLEKAQKLDMRVDPLLHFMLGRAYHLNLQWDKAIAEYNKALKSVNGTDSKEKGEELQKYIAECKNGKELVKKPVNVKIENVGPAINTIYPEYGAVISADESVMIFTSKRNTNIGGDNNIDPMTKQFYEDIYISNKKDGKWEEAQNIGKPINDAKNNATAGISLDGQTLFVYFGDNNGDIGQTQLQGDKWLEPKLFGGNINTKKNQESSASLSYDGKTLYFVSDRPGGLGDRDIYYCLKDASGKWGEPVNMGPGINTPYGEEGVFAHPDGKTLYFSSQGWNSMGGYDVFKSTLGANGKWSKPVNLGYPINTPDDDVFFVLSGSGKHGYYASAKGDSYGEKDIYMISFLESVKDSSSVKTDSVKTISSQTTLLKGIITDAQTGSPLEATIEVVDNQKNVVIASFNSNSSSGKYLISLPSGKNYGIAVKSNGYLFHSENFDIPVSGTYQEIEKNIALNKIAAGSKIILNNIFFDTGKSDLRKESTNELERLLQLMNEVLTLKIEISGHTDNVGSADYNKGLSEARAKSVVDYLIKKGIDKERMVFKGYGFTQPIADNSTEEGRQLNRRTEFKILSK